MGRSDEGHLQVQPGKVSDLFPYAPSFQTSKEFRALEQDRTTGREKPGPLTHCLEDSHPTRTPVRL